MKANKYHRQVLRYLLKNERAKSAYQIANAYSNVDNDHSYKAALDDFIKINDVTKKDGFYILYLDNNLSFLKSKDWRDIFSQSSNDELVETVLSGKRMTFIEWINNVNSFSKILAKDILRNKLKNNALLNIGKKKLKRLFDL